MEDENSRYGKEFEELLFNIRQTMQIVQAQFEVMKSAIDKRSRVDPENDIECVDALNNAHREI
jgi:hypothetical protein